MEFARINKDKIIRLYVDEGKSSYEVAEKLNTYSTKVLRALDFLGIERRSYSKAQSNSIEKGRTLHPTKGKKLKEEHKKKIGTQRAKAWAGLSPEERERISLVGKDLWNKKPESEKQEMRRMAMEAVREASKIGSRTERHLDNALTTAGYNVMFHKNDLVARSKLEVDLFLPEIKTAIEIDGPGHFLPIWGQEKLQKQQSSDIIKQGILIDHGYVVLRIKQIDKSISMTKMNALLEIVLSELDKIKKKFPSKKKRLIEIEVQNGESKRI
jgi:very-short-patch-repair endonuclease